MSTPVIIAELSNVHADLAEQVRATMREHTAASRAAIAKAIEAGGLLHRARGELPHGQWTPFLRRAGVHERQARRLIQLHRSCLTPDMMSDLGGIAATLDWLATWPAPAGDDCIVIWRGEPPGAGQKQALALAWPRDGDLLDFGVWETFADVFSWAGRGMFRHGLPLMTCSVLNTKRPSELGWCTLYGQGPYWRAQLMPRGLAA
jgi:hypothetical protein